MTKLPTGKIISLYILQQSTKHGYKIWGIYDELKDATFSMAKVVQNTKLEQSDFTIRNVTKNQLLYELDSIISEHDDIYTY